MPRAGAESARLVALSVEEPSADDRRLAERHDIEFRVIGRPADYSSSAAMEQGQPFVPPTEHGSFSDPADAVALARSLSGQDVTVLADGAGAYWYSTEPERVFSDFLVRVCRDKVLGAEEAQRQHQREEHQLRIEELRTEQHLPAAVEFINGASSVDAAIEALQRSPLQLSQEEARHLLSKRSLQRLTRQGQAEIAEELTDHRDALTQLGPIPEVDL